MRILFFRSVAQFSCTRVWCIPRASPNDQAGNSAADARERVRYRAWECETESDSSCWLGNGLKGTFWSVCVTACTIEWETKNAKQQPGEPSCANAVCSVRCFFSVRRMGVLFIICTCKWLQLYTFPLTGLCVWSCGLFSGGMLLLDSMQLWTTSRSIWKGGSMYVWTYNNLRGNSCFIELRSIDCVCAYQKMCWVNLSVFEFLACLWETEKEEIFKSTYVYYRTLPNERAFAKSVRNKNTSKII